MPDVTDLSDKPADRRDRRLYIWWGIAFALLALLGTFCWLIVAPCLRVRSAIKSCHGQKERFWLMPRESDEVCWRHSIAQEQVSRLGGSQAAFGSLKLYLRLPERLAPDKSTARALLAECGRSAVPELVKEMEKRDQDWAMTTGVLAEIVNSDCTEAIDPFIAVFKNGNHHELFEASRGLEHIGKPAVQPLIAAMNHQDWPCRELSASTLGAIGDKRAVKPLIAALKDPQARVRQAAAGALGDLKDPSAIKPLEDALADPDNWTRHCVSEALKAVRGEEAPK
ncbi:MAG TPA: HEAT repeat domain-containing protein [Planctomycetota bacterium]|nr:HEAT repeat domain-containing protein [Planctomycetota bacterium]